MTSTDKSLVMTTVIYILYALYFVGMYLYNAEQIYSYSIFIIFQICNILLNKTFFNE